MPVDRQERYFHNRILLINANLMPLKAVVCTAKPRHKEVSLCQRIIVSFHNLEIQDYLAFFLQFSQLS